MQLSTYAPPSQLHIQITCNTAWPDYSEKIQPIYNCLIFCWIAIIWWDAMMRKNERGGISCWKLSFQMLLSVQGIKLFWDDDFFWEKRWRWNKIMSSPISCLKSQLLWLHTVKSLLRGKNHGTQGKGNEVKEWEGTWRSTGQMARWYIKWQKLLLSGIRPSRPQQCPISHSAHITVAHIRVIR